jgi:ElaB/YqjD/DUF883 family membrane-anchored ribosome-binding protein
MKKVNAKKIKKAIKSNVRVAKKVAREKGDELQKIAMQEYAKIKKEMASATKKVEGYVKKNPEKAALISAGIGAAIGAALAGLTVAAAKGKKKR